MKRSRRSGVPYWAYWGQRSQQPRRWKEPPRKAHFEPLEQRVLLSGDLNYVAAAGAALNLTLPLDEPTQNLQLVDYATSFVLAEQAARRDGPGRGQGGRAERRAHHRLQHPVRDGRALRRRGPGGQRGGLLRILSESGQTVKIGAGDGASISVSNVEDLLGGSGSNFLIGPDADSAWTVTGAGSGSVAGVAFTGFGTLSGGSGSDAFVFEAWSRAP